MISYILVKYLFYINYIHKMFCKHRIYCINTIMKCNVTTVSTCRALTCSMTASSVVRHERPKEQTSVSMYCVYRVSTDNMWIYQVHYTIPRQRLAIDCFSVLLNGYGVEGQCRRINRLHVGTGYEYGSQKTILIARRLNEQNMRFPLNSSGFELPQGVTFKPTARLT
jgi:hypothetical protein